MSISVLNTDAGLSGKTLVTAEGSTTQTGLITFDRDPNPPFAVSANSAVVPNLDADSVDGADYAEGTWTPTVTSAGGGTAAAYTLQSGTYVKMGQMVVVNGQVALNGKGTLAAGDVRIGGLPFTTSSTSNGYGGSIGFFGSMTTSVVGLYLAAGPSVTYMNLWHLTAAAVANSATQISNISDTFNFQFTLVYRASS
jgi:hypothetical protein